MSGRRVRFLPIAREEIFGLFWYISADDEQAAIGLVDRIETRAEALGSMPYMGVALPPSEYPEMKYAYRKLSVRPYGIYYFVTKEEVVIAHVIHDKQDIRRILTGRGIVLHDDK